MKAEINNKNKAKFFSPYLGQKVAGNKYDSCYFELTEISILDCEVGMWGDWSGGTHPQTSQNDMIGISDVWLNLKPLSDISDEDAIEVAKMLGCNDKNSLEFMISYGKDHVRRVKNMKSDIVDFLRSCGYLVPWMGLSPGEIIEAGWAKYKE